MTIELRDLTATKLAAYVNATRVPSDKTVADTPTAAAATKAYSMPLVCKRSGITVGNLSVTTVAGHMPMVGQWKETMVLHPLFSLTPVALLHFARNTWFRFCSFSLEEGMDDALTAKQEQTLRVTALAMLHHLANVRQDIPWLPDWSEVSAHWSSLMALSYWKAALESERFRFPAIHISKFEPTLELKSYLQACWQVKKDYETRVSERIEQERLRATETAMIALRDEIAGARPTSSRQLWRWFLAHLPKRYEADSEGWMRTLFFAKGDDVKKFTMADIDLFEEIFLCEVPTGSSISHAFSEVLASKRKVLEDHVETFEILIPQTIQDEAAAGAIPLAEPKREDFASKVAYMIAHAKWSLAHTNVGKTANRVAAAQAKVSVKPSYVPQLTIYEQEDAEETVLTPEEAGLDAGVSEQLDENEYSIDDGGTYEE